MFAQHFSALTGKVEWVKVSDGQCREQPIAVASSGKSAGVAVSPTQVNHLALLVACRPKLGTRAGRLAIPGHVD